MSSVVFHAEAAAEFGAAARYYESRRSGLGAAFISEVERTTSMIELRPLIGAPFGASHRRAIVRRFPYTIIYRRKGDAIEVVAVAHQHRRPGYWRERM